MNLRFIGNVKLWFKKNKSDICTYGGMVVTGIGAGLGINATLKNAEKLKAAETKTEKAKAIVETYAVPGAVYAGGNALIVVGHKDAKAQLVATNAMLIATTETLNRFYKNVKEEVGDEKAFELAHGMKKNETTIINEDGTHETETFYDINPNELSIYSKIFDESNPNWEKSPLANKDFLIGRQRWFTEKLRIQGYLFLNDVYRDLGFPCTKVGQIAGWIYDENDPNCDNYVDLGIFSGRKRANDFVNGYEPCIILDFNCNGNIMDDDRLGFYKW